MIIGAKHWSDRRAYYSQKNNPTEQILRKCFAENGLAGGWLETCGPTAALNCLSSIELKGLSIITTGGFFLQSEEVLTDWFNDPRNYSKMRLFYNGLDPAKVPGNRVAQWYPLAIAEVFKRECKFIGLLSFDQVCDHLHQGHAIQSCLKSPSHFIAIVAFDDEARELIIKDSWQGRWSDKNGFCKRLSRAEFETNIKLLNLIYL